MTPRKGRSLLAPVLGIAGCLAGRIVPASAACANPSGYFYSYSYVVSPGTNTPASIEGHFWALGFGNPAAIFGDDNGTWEDTDPPNGGGVEGWLLHGNGNYMVGTWSTSFEVDGCIDGRIAPGKSGEIMVAAFSDADSYPRGYFAVTAVQRDPAWSLFNFDFPGQNIDLIAIPSPRVTGSTRIGAHQVRLQVQGPTLADVSPGVLTDGSVAPGEAVLGFRLYEHPRLPGAGPPPPRRIEPGWNPASEIAPLAQTVTVTLDCGCDTTTHLAASLVFDSGFETVHLSAALFVTCSPPICEYWPWPDFDEDGYTLDPCCGLGLDCDDANPEVHPGATEACNGIDDNCDGLVDEDALGEDSDGDEMHNLCDNCVSVRNPTQHDLDRDGEGDSCDLDDGLILVSLEQRDRVLWQAEAGFWSWNVYRGALDVLLDTGVYTQAPGSNALAGRECDLLDPTSPDTAQPDPGETAFFLVTGNTAAGEGGLGTNGRGVERANTSPCP